MVIPRKPLGQILKEMELVTEGQIQEAMRIQREQGGVLGQILQSLGYVSSEEIVLALGAQAGMEVINLDDLAIPEELVNLIPPSTAKVYKVIPVEKKEGVLTVALVDAINLQALDDLHFMLGCKVRGALTTEEAVNRALEKYYGARMDTVDSILADLSEEELVEVREGGRPAYSLDDIEAMMQSAPVVKLLNLILLSAIKDQASDIHLEPFDRDFRVRHRVDGVLYEMSPPPSGLALPLISRVKVMANLDIAESRMPQDGRVQLYLGGRHVELRVSTLPTMFGESCVIRILDQASVALSLDALGLREQDALRLRQLMERPHGIILVTGPTGSGKTTTLYAALREANRIDKKIITTEDPVEYDLPGVMQIQINEEIGLNYAICLRSILRQDPDMILVGEIRDRETAQIAVEASLTGHVVFSTLHTNDAPSAVTRMVDIGVEPYLLAATLEAVIAQRLVRRICKQCKVTYQPDRELLASLSSHPELLADQSFFYGTGCAACHKTGYRGRVAIYEFLTCSEAVKQGIADQVAATKLKELAAREGMRSLRDSGLLAITEGWTTVEEVLRETQEG